MIIVLSNAKIITKYNQNVKTSSLQTSEFVQKHDQTTQLYNGKDSKKEKEDLAKRINIYSYIFRC